MEQEDRLEKALHSLNSIDSLRTFVLQLSAEGQSKTQIVEMLEQRLSLLQEEPGREADADTVRDLLDFVLGWCSPHMKLLCGEDVPSSPSP